MKKAIMMFTATLALISQISFAQTKSTTPNQLLKSYYEVKNALVTGNSENAAANAEAFVKTANTVDYKLISEGSVNILLKDAGAISSTKDIKKQREAFVNLSKNMAEIAKVTKLSDEPIYKQYCPMKNAYWLSNEKTIKNPYYGSSMLSCGNVEETIK